MGDEDVGMSFIGSKHIGSGWIGRVSDFVEKFFKPYDDEGYFRRDSVVTFAASTVEVLVEPEDDVEGLNEAPSEGLVDFVPSEGGKP